MILKKLEYPTKDEGHQKVLFEKAINGTTINFGTVILEAGTRFPEQGSTSHTEHEFSYLAEGKISMIDTVGDVIEVLEAGMVINIDPGEEHAGIIEERCKIIYVLVGT